MKMEYALPLSDQQIMRFEARKDESGCGYFICLDLAVALKVM